ncbi:MAG: hypothetical protein ACRD0H_17755, partial [Actinomycetes bacterium]
WWRCGGDCWWCTPRMAPGIARGVRAGGVGGVGPARCGFARTPSYRITARPHEHTHRRRRRASRSVSENEQGVLVDRDVSQTAAPWAHRGWCAPECDFPVGSAEGTHQGPVWTLRPAEAQSSQVQIRLYEQVGEDTTGQVGVLASITERRLTEDLDPLGEGSGAAPGYGLVDITSSAGLTVEELERLVPHLQAVRVAAQTPAADRGDDRSG